MIYLVRHGEAAAKWGDEPDPGLSRLGREQAKAVTKDLLKLGATSAITSPMRRCRETAAPFEQSLNLAARIEPRVSEIETPPGTVSRTGWLGTLMQGEWSTASHDFTPWRQGVMTAICEIPDHTAVFTHFIAINAIVGLIEDLPEVVVFRPGNCSITVLAQDGAGFSVQMRGEEIETQVL